MPRADIAHEEITNYLVPTILPTRIILFASPVGGELREQHGFSCPINLEHPMDFAVV